MKTVTDFLRRLLPNAQQKPTWQLDDAERARDENPRSFSIPRSDQRHSRGIGDKVAVRWVSAPMFRNEVRLAANAWVSITDVRQGRYGGVLTDCAPMISEMEGTRIEFLPRHVVAVELGPEYKIPYGQSVLVSPSVLNAGEWPRNVVRVAPVADGDSGWRVTSGDEAIALASVEVDVSQLLAHYQVLDSVLDEPRARAWRWNEALNEYEEATGHPG